MTDQSKRGKRVQIYIPADLVKKWDELPRYERSAEVANALRAWWKIEHRAHDTAHDAPDKKEASPL